MAASWQNNSSGRWGDVPRPRVLLKAPCANLFHRSQAHRYALHELHKKRMEGKTKLLTRDGWSWVRGINLPDLVLAVGPRR
jgi:hypothetical protein